MAKRKGASRKVTRKSQSTKRKRRRKMTDPDIAYQGLVHAAFTDYTTLNDLLTKVPYDPNLTIFKSYYIASPLYHDFPIPYADDDDYRSLQAALGKPRKSKVKSEDFLTWYRDSVLAAPTKKSKGGLDLKPLPWES